MKLNTLILRYVFFAILATLFNLTVQRCIFCFNDSNSIFAFAVFSGTVVGLVVKYVLDKNWIFNDISVGVAGHSKKFSLYATLGIITTAIFWITETAFWFIWKTDIMRELGAIIGLSIGYLIKYHLDRLYVFTDARLAQTE